MKFVAAFMAQENCDETTIIIKDECPRMATLAKQDELFQLEADTLCDALYSSLPGGVFDRLLGAMLKIKSSHFIVSHK